LDTILDSEHGIKEAVILSSSAVILSASKDEAKFLIKLNGIKDID